MAVVPDDAPGDDPFQEVDCQKVMALLESALQRRLGEAARREAAGWRGCIRLLLQRLAPAWFGCPITPARVERLFRCIRETSAAVLEWEFPDADQAHDRAVALHESVASVVQGWPLADLRGYLCEVDQRVRHCGSLARVLADIRKDVRGMLESSQEGAQVV